MIILTVEVPPISPDFSAPFFVGLKVIVSYVLAVAILTVFVVLVLAICALVFRGFFPERMRTWAGEHIVTIFIAAAALGSVGGLFQWFINFDFGF